jgi:hypothetical protein
VPPDGICPGLDRFGRPGGVRIRVHTDAAEIVPEPRLHEGARGGVERPARGPQGLGDTGREAPPGGRRRLGVGRFPAGFATGACWRFRPGAGSGAVTMSPQHPQHGLVPGRLLQAQDGVGLETCRGGHCARLRDAGRLPRPGLVTGPCDLIRSQRETGARLTGRSWAQPRRDVGLRPRSLRQKKKPDLRLVAQRASWPRQSAGHEQTDAGFNEPDPQRDVKSLPRLFPSGQELEREIGPSGRPWVASATGRLNLLPGRQGGGERR